MFCQILKALHEEPVRELPSSSWPQVFSWKGVWVTHLPGCCTDCSRGSFKWRPKTSNGALAPLASPTTRPSSMHYPPPIWTLHILIAGLKVLKLSDSQIISTLYYPEAPLEITQHLSSITNPASVPKSCPSEGLCLSRLQPSPHTRATSPPLDAQDSQSRPASARQFFCSQPSLWADSHTCGFGEQTCTGSQTQPSSWGGETCWSSCYTCLFWAEQLWSESGVR